ncbi:Crp/Fnr family transcriptional regulator [Paraflavitalea sp. CAU 1676]|uniref:Crp/Fnr family transcriptional regulator n=1 Tax=Paraflavitalea sp. CAU 1676 TaxID=3032598 RepID=UPI0023DA3B09|nr:Crp/Fnr family transcriptional regulator [Paraflavitalea sp. CAU 1676]MDF2193784.1 Crp/Fnr family transcriptional regulator [Paraflavitalea sp. CAU 1676]
MLTADKLSFYLKLFPSLTVDDLFKVLSLAKERHLEAGEVFIREGEMGSKIAYVKSGLMRTWLCNEQGEELTLSITWEDLFVGSHDNIIFKQPSRFVCEAMEPTSLLVMEYDAIETLFAKHPEFEAMRHYFLMELLGAVVKRVESFVLLSPEERYRKLVTDRPHVVQRIPGKYLASLLGVTPVSLSRIRTRIARSKR